MFLINPAWKQTVLFYICTVTLSSTKPVLSTLDLIIKWPEPKTVTQTYSSTDIDIKYTDRKKAFKHGYTQQTNQIF